MPSLSYNTFQNTKGKFEVLFSTEIEVLLQKPAHVSIDSKIRSNFSMRALKHLYICYAAIW